MVQSQESIRKRRDIVIALLLGVVATYLAVTFGIEGEQDQLHPETSFRENLLLWPLLLLSWTGIASYGVAFAIGSLLYAAQNLALLMFVRAAVARLRTILQPATPEADVVQAERWTLLIAFLALWALISMITGLASWLAVLAAAAILYYCRPASATPTVTVATATVAAIQTETETALQPAQNQAAEVEEGDEKEW